MKLQLPEDYKLPVFPKTIRECLVYLYKSDVDTSLIAKSLSQDIGVSASILKLANSSYFLLGKGAPTTDLKTAILRIGQENLRQIMLLSALENTIYFAEVEFFNFKAFCRHASFASIVGAEIAKQVLRNGTADEYLGPTVKDSLVSDMQIAGLMHDVGLAIMANLFPDYMHKLVHFCKKHGTDFATAENKMSVEPHRELGERVLKTWDIPKNVIKVIGFHDVRDPENRKELTPEYQLMTDILVFADILAHSYAYGYKNYKRDTKIELSLLKRLGLSAEEVKVLVKTCLELANTINS